MLFINTLDTHRCLIEIGVEKSTIRSAQVNLSRPFNPAFHSDDIQIALGALWD